MNNNNEVSYAKITVEEVENGKIKSFSITNSGSNDANKIITEKPNKSENGLIAGVPVYVDLKHLDEFNKKCNSQLLNNEQIKNFLEKKE